MGVDKLFVLVVYAAHLETMIESYRMSESCRRKVLISGLLGGDPRLTGCFWRYLWKKAAHRSCVPHYPELLQYKRYQLNFGSNCCSRDSIFFPKEDHPCFFSPNSTFRNFTDGQTLIFLSRLAYGLCVVHT